MYEQPELYSPVLETSMFCEIPPEKIIVQGFPDILPEDDCQRTH